VRDFIGSTHQVGCIVKKLQNLTKLVTNRLVYKLQKKEERRRREEKKKRREEEEKRREEKRREEYNNVRYFQGFISIMYNFILRKVRRLQ